MTYRLVIFDFDGTLADSFPFFLGVLSTLADAHGFKRFKRDELEALRGADARQVIRHAGLPAWKIPAVARDFRALMAQSIDRIHLFDGVGSVLHRLAGQGMQLAVVTSNSIDNVKAVLGPENARLIAHYECGVSLFGKRSKLRRLLKATGVQPGQALCIGDELRDIDAAHAENIDFGAVGWGYTKAETLKARAPKLAFARVEEIADALLGTRSVAEEEMQR
ncbi:HAD hydrolase-like protein [Noviherbaspirillum sp.]|uniref:HAD hydrolase-like protein n=1 Tax=Noviherbaspirillum sp. TaxID=1926288 RepID=UPI002FDFD3BC